MTLSNVLTLVRIVCAPLLAYSFLLGVDYGLLTVCFFTILALTDLWDGYIARSTGKVSKLGCFLDPLADKILVDTMYTLFACEKLVPWFIIWIIVGRDIIVTLMRIDMIRRGFPVSPSKLGKGKTFVQFVVLYSLFICWGFSFQSRIDWWAEWSLFLVQGLVYFVGLLTVYSGIKYFYKYYMCLGSKLELRESGTGDSCSGCSRVMRSGNSGIGCSHDRDKS
jgi:CDP-diacylglycerol--glycerol-3-phosphate 3-phosphatidyltransferase